MRLLKLDHSGLLHTTAIVGFIVVAAGADQPRLSPEARGASIASFEQVWTTVKDKHWDAKLDGLDWDAVRSEFRPRVERAATIEDVRAALREMIGRLKRSHFKIHARDAYEDRESASAEAGRDGACGLEARVLQGQALVFRVAENSPAQKVGIRPGWRFRRVNGVELEPALLAVAKRHPSPTGRDLELAWVILRHLSGAVGEEVEIEFLDDQDRPLTFRLRLAQRAGVKIVPTNVPPRYVEYVSQRLEGDRGYLRFNAWYGTDSLERMFSQTFDDFRTCKGIVIDLRGNRGGVIGLAAVLAGHFIAQEGTSLGTLVFRDASSRLTVIPQPAAFRGPVAILVDGLTRSTSEIFTAGCKSAGRVRVFGSRTAGEVQASVSDRLPNGDTFQYSLATFVTVDHQQPEGAGVSPDVEIVPTRADLLARRDPVLDAALGWIQRALATHAN